MEDLVDLTKTQKGKELLDHFFQVRWSQEELCEIAVCIIAFNRNFDNHIADFLFDRIQDINLYRGNNKMSNALEQQVWYFLNGKIDKETILQRIEYLIKKGININHTWQKSTYSALSYGVMSMLRVQIPEEAKIIMLLLRHGYSYETFKKTSFVDAFQTWEFCRIYFRLFPYLVASQSKYRKVPCDFPRILSTFLL